MKGGNLVQKSEFVPVLKDTRGEPRKRNERRRKQKTHQSKAQIQTKIHRGDIHIRTTTAVKGKSWGMDDNNMMWRHGRGEALLVRARKFFVLLFSFRSNIIFIYYSIIIWQSRETDNHG